MSDAERDRYIRAEVKIGYLEDTLALLEGYGVDGETSCFVTASGMAAMGEESRSLADISPDLLRLSVGAEHPDDVINDLDQALARAR